MKILNGIWIKVVVMEFSLMVQIWLLMVSIENWMLNWKSNGCNGSRSL